MKKPNIFIFVGCREGRMRGPGGDCVLCPKGTYSEGVGDTCTPCPEGQTTYEEGADLARLCYGQLILR